ncbi:hypothetical protein JCM3766R1_004351 [Sporobolomyces carnicolor]
MSWSRSLRSRSPTPPTLSPPPNALRAASLWANDGDRHDPIDIGTVWEPQINFTETPFTIAKRNANASLTKPHAAVRTKPTLSKDDARNQRGSVRRQASAVADSGQATKTGTASETQAHPSKATNTRRAIGSSLATASKHVARVCAPPKVVEDVFFAPSRSDPSRQARSKLLSEKSPLQTLPCPRLDSTPCSKSRSSTRERSLNAREENALCGIDSHASKLDVTRSVPATASCDEIAASSSPAVSAPSPLRDASPNLTDGQDDSSGDPFTDGSSPIAPALTSAFPVPRTAGFITPRAVAPVGTIEALRRDSSLPSPSVRPYPLAPVGTIEALRRDSSLPSPSVRPYPLEESPLGASTPPHPRSSREARRVETEFAHEPSPFLCSLGWIETPSKPAPQSTRAKLEKFRNPLHQTKAFPLCPLPTSPDASKLRPESTVLETALMGSEPVTRPQLETARGRPPRHVPELAAPVTPGAHQPLHSRHWKGSNGSVPQVIPVLEKPRRTMNFLPLEPIESFQKRKGIIATSITSSSPSRHGSPSSWSDKLDEELDSPTRQKKRGPPTPPPRTGHSVFGSSLDQIEKVVLGTNVRSLKPTQSSSAFQTVLARGRGRGRGRGGARSGTQGTRRSANGSIESTHRHAWSQRRSGDANEQEQGGGENEETRAEKLRRLYRSFD